MSNDDVLRKIYNYLKDATDAIDKYFSTGSSYNVTVATVSANLVESYNLLAPNINVPLTSLGRASEFDPRTGVFKPKWLVEAANKIKARYPDLWIGDRGGPDRRALGKPVSFPWNGILWDGVLNMFNVSPEVKVSLEGNFSTAPNFAIFMQSAGYAQGGKRLVFSTYAAVWKMVQTGEKVLPDGVTKIPEYKWEKVEDLPDVWFILPKTYKDEDMLKQAFLEFIRYEYEFPEFNFSS